MIKAIIVCCEIILLADRVAFVPFIFDWLISRF